MLAYKFRLLPNKEEERKLLWTREACRRIYGRSLLGDDRDHASSLVILDRGLQKVRSERPELTLVERRPLLVSAKIQQVGWMKQEAALERAG